MSTLAIVLIAFGALLLILIVGGLFAASRRAGALDGELRRRLSEANDALAEARSQDRGWERSALEAVARGAFQSGNPDLTIEKLHLVQVVDKPGTDSDEAVFEICTAGDAVHSVTLGRRDGAWIAV